MPTEVACPSCQARLRIADQFAGKRVKCPKCGGIIEPPAAEEEAFVAEPLPPAPRRRELDEDEEPRSAPSWSRGEQPHGDEDRGALPRKKLGSLAQTARGKELKTVRIILVVIGILNLLGGVALIVFAKEVVESAVKQELAKKPGAIAIPEKVQELIRLVRLLGFISAGVGALYLLFAFIVKLYPVPVTVASLVIYAGSTLVGIVMNPDFVNFCSLVIPILIIIAMVKAVQAAIAYQKQRNAEARQAEEGYES